jgi:hypothetical protein
MKRVSKQQSSRKDPSSPGRRTFVKGIAAVGAGSQLPRLIATAEAKAPASGNRFLSQTNGTAGALEASQTFQGDKISWHGFDRYDFVMDIWRPWLSRPLRRLPAKNPAVLETRPRDSCGVLWLCPNKRPPAIAGPGEAFTGTTSRRLRSNCSDGAFTSYTSRSIPRQSH